MELRQAHLDLRTNCPVSLEPGGNCITPVSSIRRKKQDEATALRRATRAVAQRGGGPPPPEASPPAQEEVLFDGKVNRNDHG